MEKESLNVPKDTMILGDDCYYDLDTYKTLRNNNTVIIGSPGSSKTRGIVIPNLLQASGSYVITDPKGNLYDRYGGFLRRMGYDVKRIDFMDHMKSIRYNILKKTGTEDDIATLAHTIVYSNHDVVQQDPYWDEGAKMLLTSILSYFRFHVPEEEWTFKYIVQMLNNGDFRKGFDESRAPLDILFRELGQKNPDDFAYRKYRAFRIGADVTMQSIAIVLQTTLSHYDIPSVNRIMEGDDLNIQSIGRRKTALFITVSDSDRRLDGIVNIAFTQIMQGLVKYADLCDDQHLPIPVRFLMDDFATNVNITGFPSIIASIRSRWISTMLILQAESQLMERYGKDGRTILGSCDTYVYLGGGDLETATNVAKRADRSVKSVLEMPLGTGLIFRRGEKMRECRTFPLEEFERIRMGQKPDALHVATKSMQKNEKHYDKHMGLV